MSAPPALDLSAAVFLDVDGTLLGIAPRPELVRVPPGLPRLLERLSRQREGALALISGRPIAQLDALFAPWHGAASGLHGGERRNAEGDIAVAGDDPRDRAAAAALDRARPMLAALARRDPRLLLEDKGTTVALHFRGAPERGRELSEEAETLHHQCADAIRLIAGKMVLEFQPRHRTKGAAIAAFLAESPFRGRRPVFVGDDVTDEDGFREVNRRGGLSVRVGRSGDTAARHCLPSVTAARRWLAEAAATPERPRAHRVR